MQKILILLFSSYIFSSGFAQTINMSTERQPRLRERKVTSKEDQDLYKKNITILESAIVKKLQEESNLIARLKSQNENPKVSIDLNNSNTLITEPYIINYPNPEYSMFYMKYKRELLDTLNIHISDLKKTILTLEKKPESLPEFVITYRNIPRTEEWFNDIYENIKDDFCIIDTSIKKIHTITLMFNEYNIVDVSNLKETTENYQGELIFLDNYGIFQFIDDVGAILYDLSYKSDQKRYVVINDPDAYKKYTLYQKISGFYIIEGFIVDKTYGKLPALVKANVAKFDKKACAVLIKQNHPLYKTVNIDNKNYYIPVY